MSLLCAGSPPPRAFLVSVILWVSNAALFHACACAASGLSQPAAASSASRPMPLPVLTSSLRLRFIRSPIVQTHYLTLLPPRAGIRRGRIFCAVPGPSDNAGSILERLHPRNPRPDRRSVRQASRIENADRQR